MAVNVGGVRREARAMMARRSVRGEAEVPWLLRAVCCLDLTTLAGDDTPGTIARLCAKAKSPIRKDILRALGVEHMKIQVR
eukprot:666036-Hanusia_phi.AAC.1